MRHLKRTAKLGRTGEHRNAMLANMVCSLIKHKRITTTLAKAKAARSVAEKMVTLGKHGTLHARRLAAARLHARPAGNSPRTRNARNGARRKTWCAFFSTKSRPLSRTATDCNKVLACSEMRVGTRQFPTGENG